MYREKTQELKPSHQQTELFMSIGTSNSILVNSAGGLDEDRIRELINEHGSALNYKSELDSTDAVENEVVVLTEDVTSQQSYTKKLLEITGGDTDKSTTASLTRDYEASTTATDFADDEFGIYSNTLTISASATAAAAFTALGAEDEIWIDATESSASFRLIITDSTTIATSARNSVTTVNITGYTATSTVTLTADASYLIRTISVSMNTDAIELLHDGNLHISADATTESAFLDLTADDEIHIVPENGNPFILDLSDTPALGEYAGADTLMLLARDFTSSPTLDIVEDTEYTIYAVKIRDEVQGSVFKFDGSLWKRLYENVVDSDNIENASVSLADMTPGTIGNVIGYDLAGNAADVGATHVITLVSSATGTSRLSYNTLKDTPTIPVDTTLWKGTYATGTAYTAGDIVLHNGDLFLFTATVTTANTESDPADVTGAEQIDVGGGGDITDISYDHPVFTLTQRDNTQTTIQIGILRPGEGDLPTSHVKGDLYLLQGANDVDVYTTKLSRTALSSTDNSDFATGIVQHSGGDDLFFALDGTDADVWTDLEAGDKIEFVPADSSNRTIIYTLSGSPVEATRNGVAAIRVAGSLFLRTSIPSGNVGLVNNETYTIYAMTAYGALHGEIFESDGQRWKCVFTNIIDTENIEDDAVGLEQMASGTAGRVLGYNSSGDPAELTGAPIVDLIEALSGRDRLNYDAIRNKPTIPLDSTIWSGQYAANTAYDAGDIVYDGNNIWLFRVAVPNTNTATDPSTITGAEQIDVGGPTDVTAIEWDDTTKTLTVTVRSGTETEHKLDNRITFGTALPTASAEDDIVVVTDSGDLETYTQKLTRTASSTSLTAGGFFIGASTAYFSASTSEQTAYTSLASGDRIVAVPNDDDNDTLIFTLSAAPSTQTVAGVSAISLSGVPMTGTFDDEDTYTIYDLKERNQIEGAVLESDGNFWTTIYNGRISASHIPSRTITTSHIRNVAVTGSKLANLTITGGKVQNNTLGLNKVVQGTAGKYVRYNSSRNLEEADAVPVNNSLTTAMYQDNSVTLAKLAGGTANRILGFDSSGDPAETTRRGIHFGSTSFPANPHTNDIFIFKSSVDSGITWKDTDGTTDLSAAARADAALWNGTNWVKQLNLAEDLEDGSRWYIGASYPDSHIATNLLLVEETSDLESYLFKGNRTAEADDDPTEFADGEFGVFNDITSDFAMSVTAAEQTLLTGLVSGDRLVAVPKTGTSVIFTLTGSPIAYTRNSIRCIRIATADFSQSTNLLDGTVYTVYALRTQSERQGNILESDGNFWERVYELGIDTEHLEDDSVTLAKLDSGTAGNIIGYDASGDPESTTRRNVTFGRSTTFPANPHVGDIHIFTADTTINWKDINGSTDLTDAVKSDVARWNGTNWVKQMTLSEAVSGGGSGTDFHVGTSYPSSHNEGDHFLLETTGNLETYRFKGTRTGETNPAGTQFESGEMGVYSGVFTIFVTASEQTTLTTFGSGDRLVLVPASGNNIIITMSGGFNTGTLNSHRILRLFARDFTISGTIADNTIYTVYGLRTRSELAGNVFESDGNFFERVYQLRISADHLQGNSVTKAKMANASVGVAELENDAVTLAKMQHVSAGEEESIIGYNSSGEPIFSRRRSVDFGTGFPTDPAPKEGDVFVFTSDVARGLTWISESGAALTDANEGDVAVYSASTWARRINFGSADATGGSGDTWSFGSAYPASPSDEDLFKLSQNGTLERYLTVVPRDAETSTTAGDFGSAEMGIYNGSFIMQASVAEQSTFTSLGSGDKIVAIPSSGDTVTLSLTGSPVAATRNSLTAIRVASSDFTIENALVDGTRYQVYALQASSAEVKGNIFEFDGNYWARIYENTLTASHIPNSTLSINKLSNGTAGHAIGFDSGGIPAELEKTNLIVSGSLRSVSNDPFAKLYLTDDVTSENIIVYKSSGTAETATLESEFDVGEVGIYGNDFFWALGTESLQDLLIEEDLLVGDIILFSASGQSDVSITISALNSGATPLTKATRNLHRSITIDEDHFTLQGTFVDSQSYSVYFLKNNGTEIQGSLYQRTDGYWERIYQPDPPKHYIQETFPDDIRDDDTLHLTATASEEILEYGPITKTAETSTTEGDFAAGEVGVFSNDLIMAVTEQEQEAITELELKTYSNQASAIDLVRDDVILFKSDLGDIKVTIIANDWGTGTAGTDPYDDDSPVKTGTRNSVNVLTIDSTKFNQIGNFVDEREYKVYFIKKNRDQRPDTYYRAKEIDTDELYWERIYDPSETQDASDSGTSSVSPNLRQLTQWKRASSTPDAPGNTTIDYEGFYTNFPDTANSWSASVPSGADALYVATATITRNTAGEWGYNSTWSVTPESSSQIQFWHVTNQAWEASATAGRNSQMRIWTSAGWKIIPLEGEFKLMEKWMNPGSVSAVSNVRLSDIDKMRFEIVHFHSQFQISVSRSMLFGEDNTNLGTGTPTSANQTAVDNNTVYLYWDYRGAMRIWKKTPNDDVDITNTAVEGMIRINFYKNSEDELTHISTFSPLGRAVDGLGYGALLRVYLEV